MPTFENPAAGADEVQTALRALAHATRAIEDPRQIYSVLGALTSAVASLSQSLHQLAAFHDGAAHSRAMLNPLVRKHSKAAAVYPVDVHSALAAGTFASGQFDWSSSMPLWKSPPTSECRSNTSRGSL